MVRFKRTIHRCRSRGGPLEAGHDDWGMDFQHQSIENRESICAASVSLCFELLNRTAVASGGPLTDRQPWVVRLKRTMTNFWASDFKQPLVLAALVGFTLAACATGPNGVRVVNGGTSAISAQEGQKIRNLTSGEIAQAISGKTFQYTRADGNGFVSYNADGTLRFQDDVKGEGVGTWSANGEQYCESFGPGNPPECGIFKNTGDAFFAANSRLVEMKV